ncbi:hypothetical protein HG531_005017 [Fusarium graminearum]|nr:hypothetical protein HG531_005017 [Fusarium graminearum]
MKEGEEIGSKDTAHTAPAVHEVLCLRVISVGNVGLDIGEEVNKGHGVLAEAFLSNSQGNQRSTFHGLGAQKSVLLLALVLENVNKERHKSIVKLIQVWLKSGLLSLLTEVDKSSSCMGLDSTLGGAQDRNNGLENTVVVVGLHFGGKIGAHLTKSIAASPSDSRVRILECGNHQIKHLAELANHEIATTFRDS